MSRIIVKHLVLRADSAEELSEAMDKASEDNYCVFGPHTVIERTNSEGDPVLLWSVLMTKCVPFEEEKK